MAEKLDRSDERVEELGKVLLDVGQPLAKRFRVIFLLKAIGTRAAIEQLGRALAVDESALLRHEVAYAMGQTGNVLSIPHLKRTLEQDDNSMVRHEAGESLGAIGTEECLGILEQYLNDESVDVRETCEIAVAAVKWKLAHPEEKMRAFPSSQEFASIDPAPPSDAHDVERLRQELLDSDAPLFQRYRAMFSLRNMRTDPAVLALCDGLEDTTSALFRHEIAYVLGQLQSPVSVAALKRVLAKSAENEMVRHEAAEALGAIATQECTEYLRDFLHDEKRVVKESCDIALDVADYYTSEQFQYAS
mmetsp:Transcript_15143/g.43064  ORF Transcript_15143/g.43064 Transcript_15143/m.43064 type:complete len:304 (+) Transcript_15143:66-977(+)|eukprot:CAMPEP_0119121936 /NCGR_PEP_ID=MMETSP1310-20130426/2345_1 /TAXON_ID=464262 /ORGANISM="Genus nov. species nov., Strain RCC2339" /LENGTH=303 /DNA_ID=CAMNT_0007111531 /DNA_START=134 /DNA_END=1045 /DNA_ORIENTATION=-